MNKSCPMCREEKFKVFPNKQLDREIKGLLVRCSNRKTGCIWQGEMNGFTKHVDDECQFVDVNCPSGCAVKLKRQCVQDHLANDCPCYCKYCDTSGHSDWIALRHKEHCNMYPIPCPNRCEVGVTRSVGIDAHRKVCPLEVVQCEYHDVGCDIKLVRKDFENHIRTKMVEHLNLIKCHFANTTEELRKTEQDLKVTKEALDKTRSNFDKLTTRLATAESQVTSINTKTDKRLKDINNKLQRSFHNRQIADHDEPPAFNDVNENGDETVPSPFLSKITNILMIMCLVVIFFATQIDMINNRITLTEKKLWPGLLDHVSKLSNTSTQAAPVIFKISNFSKEMDDVSDRWSSNSFLAFEDGYEIFLLVSVAGSDEYKNLVVSLLFNKNTLQELDYWPLRAMFTVELLNQLTNSDHYDSLIPVDADSCYLYKKDRNSFICSYSFISMKYLHQKSNWYLREDAMYLQVSYIKGLYYYFLRFKNYWFPSSRIIYDRVTKMLWCCLVLMLTMECLDVFQMNIIRSWFGSWKSFNFIVDSGVRLSVALLLAFYIYDYIGVLM